MRAVLKKERRYGILSFLYSIIILFLTLFTLPVAHALEVTLTWEKPEGPINIDGYKIYYTMDDTDFDNAERIKVSGAERTYCVISGLQEDSVYYISAASFKNYFSRALGYEFEIIGVLSEPIEYQTPGKLRKHSGSGGGGGGCFIETTDK